MKKKITKLLPTYANVLLLASMYASSQRDRVICSMAYQQYYLAERRGYRSDYSDMRKFNNLPESPFYKRCACKYPGLITSEYGYEIKVTKLIKIIISGTRKYVYSDEKYPWYGYGPIRYKSVGTIIKPNVYVRISDPGYEDQYWSNGHCDVHQVISFTKLKKYLKTIRKEHVDLLEYPNSSERIFCPDAIFDKMHSGENSFARIVSYTNGKHKASVLTNRICSVNLIRFRDDEDKDFRDRLNVKTDLVLDAHAYYLYVPVSSPFEKIPDRVKADANGRFPDNVENAFNE